MRIFLRWLFPLIGLAVLLYPGTVFFADRGGLQFLTDRDIQSITVAVFPLVGLYAFTLLWMQLILGSFMPWWRSIFPGVERWHRTQGVFVFLFSILHPSLLLFGIGFASFTSNNFIDARLAPFVFLGRIALLLMTVTVLTAVLRKTDRVRRWWRQIHFLNYLIFGLVWLHSWNLGTDVQSSGLRWLWLGFGLTVVSAVLLRIFGLTWSKRLSTEQVIATTDMDNQKFISVAKLEDIQPGQPFCARLENKTLALFRVGNQVFALDNVCSHAGGSLCQGKLDGVVIECPLHYTRFNVRTGAFIDGPASQAQATYRVRISGDEVQVASS